MGLVLQPQDNISRFHTIMETQHPGRGSFFSNTIFPFDIIRASCLKVTFDVVDALCEGDVLQALIHTLQFKY